MKVRSPWNLPNVNSCEVFVCLFLVNWHGWKTRLKCGRQSSMIWSPGLNDKETKSWTVALIAVSRPAASNYCCHSYFRVLPNSEQKWTLHSLQCLGQVFYHFNQKSNWCTLAQTEKSDKWERDHSPLGNHLVFSSLGKAFYPDLSIPLCL